MSPPIPQKIRISSNHSAPRIPFLPEVPAAEENHGGEIFTLPDVRRLQSDISSWIPRLWNRPEGDPAPGVHDVVDSVMNFLEEGLEEAESACNEALTNLNLVEPEAEVSVSETPPTESQVLECFSRLEKLPSSDRQALWERLLERIRAEGSPCPEEGCGSYEEFQAALRELGANLPSRVHGLRTALALISRHETLGETPIDRPIALVVLASSDHNGALRTTWFPMLDTLEDNGCFHTLYVEADDEGDILRAMEEIHALTGHRVHTLVWGGHGTSSSLALGGEDLGVTSHFAYEESDYIDPSDFVRGEFASLDDLLEPDGQVLLWSCSNGEGGEEAPFNMANSTARAVPGRRVYSMREPGNILSLEVEADHSLAVEWTNHSPYIAVSDGALPPLPHRESAQNEVGG